MLPLQQPLGHDVESQTHCPLPLHSWPGTTQALQVLPDAPHIVFDSSAGVTHVPPLQQPGQLVPPQVQAPPEQASPLLHFPQAAPPDPHSLPSAGWSLNSTHAPLASQQPAEQDVASQEHLPVRVSHVVPEAQGAHAAPPMPHSLGDSDANAVQIPLALQHPSGQVLGPHALGLSGVTSVA